jgi:predicted secreted protein
MAQVSKKLVFKKGGVAVAQTRNITIDYEKEPTDVTTADSSAGWKEYILSLKGATISGDGLIVRDPSTAGSYGTLIGDFLTSDASVGFELTDETYTNKKVSGQGYFTKLNESFAYTDNIQTYSFEFLVNGVPVWS